MRTAPKLLVLVIILASIAFKAKAVDAPVVVAKLEGSTNQLVVGAQAAINIYTDLPYSSFASVNRIRNVVTFKINEESPVFFSSAFTAAITYKIYFEDANAIQDSTAVQTLTLNYDTAATYTQRASFQFFGGYKATVKIVSITASSSVIPALVLTNEMYANVDYQFSCTNDTVQGLTDVDTSSQLDERYVRWTAITGADEYDLEWAYVDSSALDNYTFSGNPAAALIFENGATRVTLKDSTHYRIPLLYDYKGFLYFRVRGIQNKVNGRRIEGKWTWGLNSYFFVGHADSLNWQATTSYAEDGKRKSVVQYFDGTLRARQTVTKDNTLGTTIVAETFYDYQGRPVINVLPAPTLNTVIQYAHNFNVNTLGGEYGKNQYDSLGNASSYCSSGANPMGTQSGAARYYSSSNPLGSTDFHQYIPTANGFSFVETRYEQDNTGRIAMQSGVGPHHQLGGGHETRYFYGSPSTKELHGLFGTEVGDATHYQKNMVRDANGQYSVSYVDMNGRTIATALAGQAPSGMDPLPSNQPITITEPVITPASNHTDGLSMIASKGLLVPKAGQHRFVYSLLPDSLTLANCNSINICYDCYYDLEITISNDCNNDNLPGNKPIVIRRTNLTIPQIDSLCNVRVAFPAVDTTVQLTEGSYLVTKKLTVSRWAMEYYRDSVFLRNNTCKTKEDFVREVLDSLRLQPADCTPECASCLTSVGDWESFHASYMQQSGYAASDTASYQSEARKAYNNALDACAALCNSVGDDATIRKAMLWDVSPTSGQYANPDTANSFSIFYKDPADGDTARYAQRNLLYLNENGNPDTVFVNGVALLPNQLLPEEFATYFKKSWAETLLPFHPEFCKLQKYEQYSDSHAWDVRFENVETFQAARDSGFLNPTGGFPQFSNSSTTIVDPLFNKGYTYASQDIRDLMEHWMENFQQIDGSNFISMWSLATLTAACGTTDTNCATNHTSLSSAFDTTTLCEGELDMAWRSFRSFYMTKKRELVRQLIDSCGAISLGYYQSRFIDPATQLTQPANSSQAAVQAQSQLAEHFVTTCEAYAEQWVHELSKCSAYNVDSLRAHVIPKLIQVCIKGSDATHLYGSSTISPDSNYTFNSFEAVLEWYNDSLALDSANRTVCNSFLLTGPKPYNQSTVYRQIPVWNKPDSCVCEKIEELYVDYQSNNSHYTTFSAYLQAVHQTTISQGALDTLRGLCDSSITCNYLATPISLPAALQCGVSNVCIDCEEMRNGYQAYRLRFPGSYPRVDTTGTDTLQTRVNTVFANFLNTRFGFSYSAADYFMFMKDCEIGVSAYQDTLWQRIADFRDYYLTTPQNQVWRTWKITPAARFYINSLNAVLKATQNPLAPQLPAGYRLHPFSTTADVEMKSVIKSTSDPADSSYHTIVPLPLHNTINYPAQAAFAHMNNNMLRAYHFSAGTASDEELRYKYFAVATRPVLNFFHNMWCGTGNSGAFPYYGMSVPDSTFIPRGAGFTSWENHIQALALYKPALSVVDSATYMRQYNDSIYVGTWWGDFGNNTIVPSQIKLIKNLRFDPTVLPLADMWAFAVYPTGLKVTLEMRNGTESDAYIFSTYAGYIQFKEPIDSALYNPDCKTAFRNFFNQRSDSAYTTTQIDAILNANGIVFNYCDTAADTTKLLCGKTEVFQTLNLDGSNCNDSTELALTWAEELYTAYRDSLKNAFEAAYLKKCLAAFQYESFTMERPHSEYHYTLYYYDQAGNLVQTVPPAGVDNRIGDASFLGNVAVAKAFGNVVRPNHTLKTNYRYNTLNQVVAQVSPDGGESYFWYDRLGRLAVSQNAKQANDVAYSYTLYDVLGRIQEVGENFSSQTYMDDGISRDATQLQDWILNSGYRYQITRTTYDVANNLIEPQLFQKNLRNRVSYTQYIEAHGDPYQSATYYSYDIHGNVDTLLQDYQVGLMADHGNQFKKLVYRYDLISGKVNHVAYQPGQVDQFYHRYQYDAENKLTDVYTTRDSVHWERDASYRYYRHGPLARTELGQQRVQGIDYAYTLQGWLKGVNSTLLCNGESDMGKDGFMEGENRTVARDAYGFALHYFDEDYLAIGNGTKFYGVSNLLGKHLDNSTGYRPLFNGNISAMSVNIGKLNMPAIYNYRYDQLNRLTGMEFFFAQNNCEDPAAELWDYGISHDESYDEDISYDPNGNILTYRRNANASVSTDMDDLSYEYIAGTNKLDRIHDAVDPGFDFDIDDQNGHNYQYDAIGNLTADDQAYITSIDWTVYGKIKTIYKYGDPSGVEQIDYTYDASGNRISKKVYNGNTGQDHFTWYVRDASGNVMAVYEYSDEIGALQLKERHLYGSSRLGIEKPELNVEGGTPSGVSMGLLGEGYKSSFERGRKYYELSNHLGNVLVTLSDKKIQFDDDQDDEVNWYEPYVVSAQDYYPFGMLMPERQWSYGSGYRYGFNGKENDNEVKGNGVQYDYGFRIYDARIGKFLSVDPLTESYPWYTPYQFAGNKPIQFIDLDGLEEALPKSTSYKVVITNAKESVCQQCPQTAQALAMAKVKADLEKLKTEYDEWRSQPANWGKPVPPQYEKVAVDSPMQTEFKQGGIKGTKEYKLFKANAEQLYTISQYAPVTGDLHDIKDVVTNLSKGDFVAAGLSAVFLIPGSDAFKPVKSLVKSDKHLLKYAKETFEGNKALSKEATDLVDKFRKGLDGGIGGHEVFKGVSELRGKNGARVYYRETKDGMEILGYSNKNNQSQVIDRLKKVYGQNN
jgi:RHS repeat-associated protein